MASFRELLARTKSEITEISPEEAEARLGSVTFLDVREQDEYDAGTIPGAVHIARGFLESQVESRVTDRAAELVVYCAGGVRSAFAVKTLADMGYTNVVSMAGGYGQWKNEGRTWITPAVLSTEQRDRYKRHLLLPEVGEEGQQRLLESKVLLLGAGGLGSPAALYLAAAGVGTLGVVDMDVVDQSNLQRQILHNIDRVGERKVDSAKKTLTALNPDVNVVGYDVRFGADNVLDILDGYDVVVDGTDNFPTRYLLNDASLLKRIPVVHGSIFRFEGQVTVFDPYNGPCYRCLLPEPRRGRRARRAPRHHRVDPGARDHQAPPRPGRPPAGSTPCLRRARAVVPHLQGASRPALPRVRRGRGRDRHRRVRPALPPARRARRRVHAVPLTCGRRPAPDPPRDEAPATAGASFVLRCRTLRAPAPAWS
jgi:molybdopterin/thiamine biosynthesis adenylyltransferase/rhodanese-related sulfurtransferase